KTSLFRLITGALTPTRGTIARQPGPRISLLDQDRDFGAATTVWEAAAGGYRELLALEESLARQGERLAALGDRVTEADLERYGATRDAVSRRMLRLRDPARGAANGAGAGGGTAAQGGSEGGGLHRAQHRRPEERPGQGPPCATRATATALAPARRGGCAHAH